MKWIFKNINKCLYSYWGMNKPFSYLRYLTIKSFRELNPDWEIKIYIPKKINKKINWTSFENKEKLTCKNYFSYLFNLNVKIESIDFEKELFPESELLSEVQKSDIFRWWLFSRFSGVWTDLDILYFNPMLNLCETTTFNKESNVGLIRYDRGRHVIFPIGFFMSGGEEGKLFFNAVYNEAKKIVLENKDSLLQYQSFGRFPLEKIIFVDKYPYGLIDPYYIYPIIRGAVEKYFNRKVEAHLLKTRILGLHWYAGHPISQEFENKINEENIHEYKDLFLLKGYKL